MKTTHHLPRRALALIAAGLLTLSGLPANAETTTAESTAQSAAESPPAVSSRICVQCGMIEGIREVAQEGESTGMGTVAGGLVGGILGRQLGDGGSFLGMLLGMAGGAYAGNKFEQHRNKVSRYEVTVRMEDGTLRTLTYESRPAWQVGERVRFGTGGLGRNGEASSASALRT
jgi:outer membrane lipoprotein SlyB